MKNIQVSFIFNNLRLQLIGIIDTNSITSVFLHVFTNGNRKGQRKPYLHLQSFGCCPSKFHSLCLQWSVENNVLNFNKSYTAWALGGKKCRCLSQLLSESKKGLCLCLPKMNPWKKGMSLSRWERKKKNGLLYKSTEMTEVKVWAQAHTHTIPHTYECIQEKHMHTAFVWQEN